MNVKVNVWLVVLRQEPISAFADNDVTYGAAGAKFGLTTVI